MEPIEKNSQKNEQFGIITRSWAGLCHHCGICAYAHKKKGSSFEKLMRWHRTWCPGWAGHTKVYGVKNLSA
jgi:hypothetical protein